MSDDGAAEPEPTPAASADSGGQGTPGDEGEGGSETSSPSNDSPSARKATELRVDAPAFVPQDRIRPVRTSRHAVCNVYENLDTVPFTPSQGICTPTPTNKAAAGSHMAGLWCSPRVPFSGEGYGHILWSPAAMLKRYPGSPGGSGEGARRSTSPPSGGGPPGTPVSPAAPPHHHGVSPPLMLSQYYFPMPISPTALHVAAAYPAPPGSPGGPMSPIAYFAAGPAPALHHPHPHAFAHHHPGAAVPAAAALSAPPGTPVAAAGGGAGHAAFAAYFAAGAAAHGGAAAGSGAHGPHHQYAASTGSAHSAQGADARSHNGSSNGAGSGADSSESGHECDYSGGEPSSAALAAEFAAALGAAQRMHGPPLPELVDLAALMSAYGLVPGIAPGLLHPPPATQAAPAAASAGGGAAAPGLARDGGGARSRRQRATPRLGPDGQPVLNARQRRTLRRAQERAVRAILDAGRQGSGEADDLAGGGEAGRHERHGSAGSASGSTSGGGRHERSCSEDSLPPCELPGPPPPQLHLAPHITTAALAGYVAQHAGPLVAAMSPAPAPKPMSRFGREAANGSGHGGMPQPPSSAATMADAFQRMQLAVGAYPPPPPHGHPAATGVAAFGSPDRLGVLGAAARTPVRAPPPMSVQHRTPPPARAPPHAAHSPAAAAYFAAAQLQQPQGTPVHGGGAGAAAAAAAAAKAAAEASPQINITADAAARLYPHAPVGATAPHVRST